VSYPSHATEFGHHGDLVVDYSIDGDVVAFDVAVPAQCVGECADAYAWALSAFASGPWERGEVPKSAATEPTAQMFWGAADSGTGPRTLTWEVSSGDWAIVIMNTDGSAGVEADVSAGAALPIIRTVAVISLVAGGLLLIGGITMIVVAIATRGRRPHQVAA
jgi:hypothetical protein